MAPRPAPAGSPTSLRAWPGRPRGTSVGSTTSATVRKRYSARQARRKRIVVPVSVTSTLGGLLDGGTVTLTRNGKDVGTATLHNGCARVRISARLRPGRTHRILA